MFKDAATNITKPVAYIITFTLQSGSVPMEWKAAKVIHNTFTSPIQSCPNVLV